MYTEKNEGCNHMTCISCKYQWCWLCEGEYRYGHYDSGKCKGLQFARADNLKCACLKSFGFHKIFFFVFIQIYQDMSLLMKFHFGLNILLF